MGMDAARVPDPVVDGISSGANINAEKLTQYGAGDPSRDFLGGDQACQALAMVSWINPELRPTKITGPSIS